MPAPSHPPSPDLRVGFLHLGEPQHGVTRYGMKIAAEIRAQGDVAVVEASAVLTEEGDRDRAELRRAVDELAQADVVHIQYNRAIWGGGWTQLRHLRSLLTSARVPIVASLHDVYVDDPWSEWRRSNHWRKRLARLSESLRTKVPNRAALRLLLKRDVTSLVCFESERERLTPYATSTRDIRVIGHFVEGRDSLPDRDGARRDLGVEGRRVVTLLGYIHRRKGPDLLVDAIEHLDADVLVVLAGAPSPGNEKLVQKLKKRADAIGPDRLRVTGYVDDGEQERWLVATDVAVAPFRFLSASGSIATWISAGRPLLSYDLPQIAEYRAIAPNAFTTFTPYDATSLATAIRDRLAQLDRDGGSAGDEAAIALRDRFSLANVARSHVALYREIAARSS